MTDKKDNRAHGVRSPKSQPLQSSNINPNVRHEKKIEIFKALVDAGSQALRIALLINSGAAIALLTFLGNVWSKDVPICAIDALTGALLLFVYGAAAVAISTGCNYLAILLYHWKKFMMGHLLTLLAILITTVSYILFIIGAGQAVDGFQTSANP